MEILKAEIADLPSILALQKLAYQSEAELVGDFTIPPLMQTIDGITIQEDVADDPEDTPITETPRKKRSVREGKFLVIHSMMVLEPIKIYCSMCFPIN